MSRVKRVIDQVLRDEYAQGSALSQPAVAALDGARRASATMGTIVFVAALVGVAVSVYLALCYVDDPKSMAAVSGAIGLSVGAALELLRRIWRDWSYFSLLLILVREADEAEVAEILRTMARKL